MGKSKIAIILLAAGSSSRMGSPKQLISWKGKTLLQNRIETAENSKADKVFIVMGAKRELISVITENKSEILVNENWEQGISSSIQCGVEAAQKGDYNAVLIMLADQPNVNSDYLNKLIKTYYNSEAKIIATKYNSGGVPAIFDKKYFEDLINLQGDKGAQSLINNNLQDCELLKADFELWDLDSVGDLDF